MIRLQNSALLIAVALYAPVSGFAENAAPANAVSPTESKLREALRSATLRERNLQSELDATRAKLEDKENELASLKTKHTATVARNAEEIELGTKHITALNAKIVAKDKKYAELDATLDRWKEEARRLDALARATEAERERLAVLSDRLRLRLADREAKNVALVKLAGEILTRLEKFGMGDAIAAREPFVGAKRVELQNYAQDYADKIAEQKAIPGTPVPAEMSGNTVSK